jgi:TolB protein
VAVSVAAGGGGGVALASGAAGHGTAQAQPRAAVPWHRVGPGWVLAEYWPGRFAENGKPKAAAATLYLISPAGVKYRLFRWASTKAPPFLLDWSGDKTRALVQTSAGGMEQIVLASGKTRRFRLGGQSSALAYTRPNGLNILGWRQTASARIQLARYGLTGKLAKVLASGINSASAVYDAVGDRLAVGGTKGVRLVSNGGGLIRSLPVPGTGVVGCTASRWWNSGTILASCVASGKNAGRLWLVPASGAKPKALTPQRGNRSRDLPSGLFLQALGPCGILQIFRQARNGSIAAVHVPQTKGNNNRLLAARGKQLLIQAQTECPGSESLLWFNPSTHRDKFLIRTPGSLAGVLAAVPFGQPVSQ